MSFTVFLDPQPRDDHVPAPDTPPTSLPTLAAVEKENLHPVTGQRPAPSEPKKRKTAALTAKALPAPAHKKHRELKGEPKKSRKPLGAAKPRVSDAKTAKPRSARKPSPLPPLVEEQPPRLSTAQLDVNARCYELTVSPLADVSDAYDQTQEPDVHTQRVRIRISPPRDALTAHQENSAEPAIRDYFSPPLPATADVPPSTDDVSRPSADLSTPERKRLHATFTFASPSPTSERFKQAQLSPSSRHTPASNSE